MFLFGRLTFYRTKLILAKVQAQASRLIELSAALVINVYSLSRVLFQFLQQSKFVSLASKRHPSDGPIFTIMSGKRKHIQLGNSASMSSDIFAPTLPPFPASRYAELVSGGHLPTISVRSAHQCASRAVYFAKAKYGKTKRPPWVAAWRSGGWRRTTRISFRIYRNTGFSP